MKLNQSVLESARRAPSLNSRTCPPHTWDCPVVTKLDPSAVAWTCSTCGAIVNAPVGAPRPPGAEGSQAPVAQRRDQRLERHRDHAVLPALNPDRTNDAQSPHDA